MPIGGTACQLHDVVLMLVHGITLHVVWLAYILKGGAM